LLGFGWWMRVVVARSKLLLRGLRGTEDFDRKVTHLLAEKISSKALTSEET
jgi:hypothetical protein